MATVAAFKDDAWLEKKLAKMKPREYLMIRGKNVGVRKNKHGASWVVRLRKGGRLHAQVLGAFGEMDREEVRKEAIHVMRQIRHGVFLTRNCRVTMHELAERFRATQSITVEPKTLFENDRLWDGILKHLGQYKVDEITTLQLEEWVLTNKHRPVWSNRAMSLLSTAMSKAKAWGMRQDNPCPAVTRYREHRFEHALTREQFQDVNRSILRRLRRAPGGRWKDHRVELYLMTLLWTGCRSQEPMRWKMAWMKDGQVRMPSHKGSRAKNRPQAAWIYMPRWLYATVRGRILREKSRLVFPGMKNGDTAIARKPVANLWLAIQDELGIEGDHPLKIFRHTLRTLSEQAELPEATTLDLLRMHSVSDVYRHPQHDHMKRAHQQLEEYLTA